MTYFNRAERFVLIAAAVVVIMAFAACPPPAPPPPLNPLTLLPTDACASSTCVPPSPLASLGFTDVCSVTPAVFATWFHSGAVALNGPVDPANSVTFPNVPNCSFYQWAEQDFLWLTSPTTPIYGGPGLILDSPAFFDVSPPASATDPSRTLLPHSAGFIRPIALRASKAGARGLQLTFDRSGTPIQVEPVEKGAVLSVINISGERVEVAHARLGKDRRPILLDRAGKVIQAQRSPGVKPEARTEARAPIDRMITARRFMIDGIAIFTDPSLAVIDVEQNEAGTNGVLEAQMSAGGSLVYYATIVNDVLAYYATGLAHNAISLTPGICPSAPPNVTCFPTTQADLNQITAFAAGHATFPDANALAIEIKSAWVEAAGLPNPGNYITMNATIPTYTHNSSTTWTASGQQTVKLALIGMHVVGSAAGHPEMIWATFEHVANAPRAAYSYVNSNGAIASVAQDVTKLPTIGGASTAWLLSATNASSFNNQNMSYDSLTSPPTITANSPATISPSDTIRWKAFGGAVDVSPNPVDPLPTGGSSSIDASDVSNTEIISINNSVIGMLASGDVRKNYVMTGATWTAGGVSPSGNNQVGTSALANTTMETYDQGKDNTLAQGGSNCFTCHSSNTTNVSHIFGALKPLF